MVKGGTVQRRLFLKSVAGAVLAAPRMWARPGCCGQIMTVTGPIPAEQAGPTLPHEHILVDFVGADQVGPHRYDSDEVRKVALPHLVKLREAGGRTLFECTPAYLGRDPGLLRRLSLESSVHLVTNTGYYGAMDNKFLPPHAFTESAEELAARWTAEWEQGIEGTGIRPGFIKIGLGGGPLPELHRKLVRAAARTHLATGLTIAAHTGNQEAALEQVSILREERVDPSAWIWVHAGGAQNSEAHVRVARQGGWVEFDSIGPDTREENLERVSFMKERNLLGRVLLSQDAGWYDVNESKGEKFRPFDEFFTRFLPALRERGFSRNEIERLTVRNPQEAFSIRARPAG
jgi:predicted metal-dependent phosphotriesterase family hydrolase